MYEIVPPPTATPQELVDRRAELEQLLATAPADQQQFIERIARSELDPTEMHEYLSAAMAVQDERREWILTSWPLYRPIKIGGRLMIPVAEIERLVCDGTQ